MTQPISILEKLSDEQIVTITADENGLTLTEACDAYFTHTLTPEEAQRFVDELQALINTSFKA